jgi:hypothetical protein
MFKKKATLVHALHTRKKHGRQIREFYRIVPPVKEKTPEINDSMVVFIIVIAVIGVFVAILR